MNPHDFKVFDPKDGNMYPDRQRLQSIVSRYLINADRYFRNVCIGSFP